MSFTSLVVAMADNGVIGKDGALPWRIPEDMRHFKALTIGKPCIMGRKTWDSLPKKPLPGRENIVVTRDRAFRAEGAVVFHSLEDAFAHACGAEEICVIGGSEIYSATLSFATRIYLTEVHGRFEGDASLPAFDISTWQETFREDHATADGLRYSYVTLERRA
ncbi:MAG TPA: dihydrofolate reductase [Rhizomicrobium sp.]|nr:dihydrofolate reductase [Rhizomicrobium sp.]